jgi:hypothetical protein
VVNCRLVVVALDSLDHVFEKASMPACKVGIGNIWPVASIPCREP